MPAVTVSRDRWLLSTLIAIHLVAISAASLPDPHELSVGISAAAVSPVDPSARVAPAPLKAIVATLSPTVAATSRTERPPLASRSIRALVSVVTADGHPNDLPVRVPDRFARAMPDACRSSSSPLSNSATAGSTVTKNLPSGVDVFTS